MSAGIARLEAAIGRVLRVGTVATTILLAAGVAAAVAVPAHPASNVLLRMGLITLMATPVARVAVSLVEYLRERDWRFAVLTAIVLCILVSSLAVALVHRAGQ